MRNVTIHFRGSPMSEIEPYYTDAEIASLLDPTGRRIRVRSIRSEREAGRLVGTRVAGKWLYRKSDVLTFLEAARCPDQTLVQSSSSSERRIGRERFSTSPGPREAEPSSTQQASIPPILTQRRHISGSGSRTGHENAAKVPVSLIRSGSRI